MPRQAGVLAEPPFAFADERELLLASLRDGVRPRDELPQLCNLLQEQRPQLGVQARRRHLEVAQHAAELEGQDRKASILVGGRGFGQHVDGGGDLPLGDLRRPLQFDQRRQPPRRVAAVILIRLSHAVDQPGDLAVHDHQPRRQQPTRLVIGLEDAAQQCSDALVGVETARDQIVQRDEADRQRRYDRLEPQERQNLRLIPFEVEQLAIQAVDLCLELGFDLVAPFSVGGRQQRGCRGDDALGGARELERGQGGWNTRLDDVEPVANHSEGVDSRRGSQHGEGADAEEREQQPRADSEIPRSEC